VRGAGGNLRPYRNRLPAGNAPFALVVYSHGLGGSREGGDVWGSAWAQAGVGVLHVQHPGSDTDAMRGGVAAFRKAASADNLLLRAADVKFVLDEITRRRTTGDALWRRVRVDALGMAGHSFGARTTQALAGERFLADADLTEPRFKAFIALSPKMGEGRASAVERFGAITRPFLCITGTQDDDPLHGRAVGDQRIQVFAGLPAGAKAQLVLEGADHYSFAGNAQRIRSGGIIRRAPLAVEREAVHHALVARLGTDWWRAQLLGDAAAREALRVPAGLGAGDSWALV
jgi:predicted dienelactone hydrolase